MNLQGICRACHEVVPYNYFLESGNVCDTCGDPVVYWFLTAEQIQQMEIKTTDKSLDELGLTSEEFTQYHESNHINLFGWMLEYRPDLVFKILEESK